MSGLALPQMPGLLAGMALAGFAFGLAYFAAVRWTASLFAQGRGLLLPLALTFGRLGAAAVLLALAARIGAAALLVLFGGMLIARSLALRVARRTG